MTNDIKSYQYIIDVNLYQYYTNDDIIILIGDLDDEEIYKFYFY